MPVSRARHRTERTLVALLDGRVVGKVYQGSGGQLRFLYDEKWRNDPAAYPLSLSMPLVAQEHKHQTINAFLWGLLPDNSRTLDHYGRLYGVSSGNAVALLSQMGADCAGAVQFTTPEGLEALQAQSAPDITVEWLTENEVAEELRSVREQGIPGATRRTVGQFSLAGAQPKIALLEKDGRWGRPTGRTPTNRILKPPSGEFRGFAENEHICLDLAHELGMGVVRSRVLRFGDEVTIVVDRFDRSEHNGAYRRIHQEDICQAMAILPANKYENEGGPGMADIVDLLRDNSRRPTEDIERFIDASVFNWIIAATDAHAKNFALLHGSGGGVRLAPFYDIVSILPYAERRLHRIKLAMKVGGEYLARRIGRRHWEDLARENDLEEYVLARVEHSLSRVPTTLETVGDRSVQEGLDAGVVNDLLSRIADRVTECRKGFELSRHLST